MRNYSDPTGDCDPYDRDDATEPAQPISGWAELTDAILEATAPPIMGRLLDQLYTESPYGA